MLNNQVLGCIGSENKLLNRQDAGVVTGMLHVAAARH